MKNLIVFSFLIALPQFTFSQDNALPNLEPYFSAVIVQNMDTSLNWYVQNLGFEVLNQVEYEEMGFKQTNLKKGDMALELIELRTAIFSDKILENQPPKTKVGGFFKFGFRVSEFDRWVKHLESSDVEFNGRVVEDITSGKRMFIVLDPDGNRIQFFEK